LRERGAPILFLISPETVKWAGKIEAQGFEIGVLDVRGGMAARGVLAHAHWLAWSQGSDADACGRRLKDRPAWLIVDHYALDKTWEAAMKPSADRLMVIDDLADREHCCNVLLDQNLKPVTSYDNFVAADCKTLIGPGYALLRPEFTAARRAEPIVTAKRINV